MLLSFQSQLIDIEIILLRYSRKQKLNLINKRSIFFYDVVPVCYIAHEIYGSTFNISIIVQFENVLLLDITCYLGATAR